MKVKKFVLRLTSSSMKIIKLLIFLFLLMKSLFFFFSFPLLYLSWALPPPLITFLLALTTSLPFQHLSVVIASLHEIALQRVSSSWVKSISVVHSSFQYRRVCIGVWDSNERERREKREEQSERARTLTQESERINLRLRSFILAISPRYNASEKRKSMTCLVLGSKFEYWILNKTLSMCGKSVCLCILKSSPKFNSVIITQTWRCNNDVSCWPGNGKTWKEKGESTSTKSPII